MRTWLSLLFIAILAASSAVHAQARLDGAWIAVSAQRDGEDVTDIIGNRLAFNGDRFTITRDGKTLFAGTFTADLTRQPAPIDFVNTEGNLKGTWKGIVRVDDPMLQICDNAPDMTKPRPETFAAPARSGYVAIVFRREGS